MRGSENEEDHLEKAEETGIFQRSKTAALFFLPVCALLSLVVSKFYAAYPFWETIFEAKESGPSIWRVLTFPETRNTIIPFYLSRFIFPSLVLAICYVVFPFSSEKPKKLKKLPVKPILAALAAVLIAVSLVARIRSLSSQSRELRGELYSTREQLETLEAEKERLLDDASSQVRAHQAEIASIEAAHKAQIAQKEKEMQDVLWQLDGLQDAAGKIKALNNQVAEEKARTDKAEARAGKFERQIQAERQAEIAEASRRAQAWESLNVGMSESQVLSLLGKPDNMSTIGHLRTYNYGSYPNRGTVDFAHGKVSGWDKP